MKTEYADPHVVRPRYKRSADGTDTDVQFSEKLTPLLTDAIIQALMCDDKIEAIEIAETAGATLLYVKTNHQVGCDAGRYVSCLFTPAMRAKVAKAVLATA